MNVYEILETMGDRLLNMCGNTLTSDWGWVSWLQLCVGLWLLSDMILTVEIALRQSIIKTFDLKLQEASPSMNFCLSLPLVIRNLLRWPWSFHKYGHNMFLWYTQLDEPDAL